MAENQKGPAHVQAALGDPNIFDMVATGQDLQVSPEIEAQVKDLMGLMTERDDVRSRFVLDVMFNEERSMHHPFVGMISVFTNGGALSGGGDEKVYMCPQKVDKDGQTKICAAPLPPNLIKHKVGLCLACKRPSEDKNFIGEVLFKLPMGTWAKVMERYFYRLDCNADFRISVFKNDLHSAAQQEQEHQMRGDKLNKVRREREYVRYRLAQIIKDTSTGATLQGRLNAFLRA